MTEIIHLHWLWASKAIGGGAAALRGLTLGISLCNTKELPRSALTAFVDDANCPRCLEMAAQPPKPPRLPRERLNKKEIKL